MTYAMDICPICKSAVEPLDKTSDADGFDYSRHNKFKVVCTVFVDANSGKNATEEQWEAALKMAKARTKPGEWPLIKTQDFGGFGSDRFLV